MNGAGRRGHFNVAAAPRVSRLDTNGPAEYVVPRRRNRRVSQEDVMVRISVFYAAAKGKRLGSFGLTNIPPQIQISEIIG